MNVANQFASAIGLKAPIIAARLKAEPGFHVLLVPTEDASLGAQWIEVEEWGVCASKILSLDMFAGSSSTVRLVPLVGGVPVASVGRVAVGDVFAPGVTPDDAIADVKDKGLVTVTAVAP